MPEDELNALVEQLYLSAIASSEISKMMAEAKSLRQTDNLDGRTDLYSWPTPDKTYEGRAATVITELRYEVAHLKRNVIALREDADHRITALKYAKELLDITNAKLTNTKEILAEAVEWECEARNLLKQAANYMPRIMFFLAKQTTRHAPQ